MESLCIPPKPCNDRPSFALLFALAYGDGEEATAVKNDETVIAPCTSFWQSQFKLHATVFSPAFGRVVVTDGQVFTQPEGFHP